jgi:hypothetical protein
MIFITKQRMNEERMSNVQFPVRKLQFIFNFLKISKFEFLAGLFVYFQQLPPPPASLFFSPLRNPLRFHIIGRPWEECVVRS